jgi:vacuolar-type H+-ATPase subunit I/STV1
MSINTVEGWNKYVRENHSKILRDRGIEPTEEALAAFQAEVKALVDKLEAEAEKRREKELLEAQRIEQEAQEMIRRFGKTKMGFPPYGLIGRVYELMFQNWRSHVIGGLAAVWFVGYTQGVRAERQRRNKNSRGAAAPASPAVN